VSHNFWLQGGFEGFEHWKRERSDQGIGASKVRVVGAGVVTSCSYDLVQSVTVAVPMAFPLRGQYAICAFAAYTSWCFSIFVLRLFFSFRSLLMLQKITYQE
jgi:hypothetical protein